MPADLPELLRPNRLRLGLALRLEALNQRRTLRRSGDAERKICIPAPLTPFNELIPAGQSPASLARSRRKLAQLSFKSGTSCGYAIATRASLLVAILLQMSAHA